ncbi:hypothetical protein [Clostridium butyricum]
MKVQLRLLKLLKLAESMGFKTKNYDNYVGTVDFSDKEKGLDILAHLRCLSSWR